jgi:hypothetical protein
MAITASHGCKPTSAGQSPRRKLTVADHNCQPAVPRAASASTGVTGERKVVTGRTSGPQSSEPQVQPAQIACGPWHVAGPGDQCGLGAGDRCGVYAATVASPQTGDRCQPTAEQPVQLHNRATVARTDHHRRLRTHHRCQNQPPPQTQNPPPLPEPTTIAARVGDCGNVRDPPDTACLCGGSGWSAGSYLSATALLTPLPGHSRDCCRGGVGDRCRDAVGDRSRDAVGDRSRDAVGDRCRDAVGDRCRSGCWLLGGGREFQGGGSGVGCRSWGRPGVIGIGQWWRGWVG